MNVYCGYFSEPQINFYTYIYTFSINIFKNYKTKNILLCNTEIVGNCKNTIKPLNICM